MAAGRNNEFISSDSVSMPDSFAEMDLADRPRSGRGDPRDMMCGIRGNLSLPTAQCGNHHHGHSTGADVTCRQRTKEEGEDFPNVISINVGGFRFMTRLSTLTRYPDSMLAAMFSGRHKLDTDHQGYYFLDSNGTYFNHILDFLRHETLPPNDVALQGSQEALYYSIMPLVERLQTTPSVAKMLVREAHRAQFPDYYGLKEKVIRIAMDNATVDRMGELLLYVFRKEFIPRAQFFDRNHGCVADTAHVNVGPWEAVAEEDALIKCLESDLQAEGFHMKPHQEKRRCKYYSGQNCQKTIYKITFIFQ